MPLGGGDHWSENLNLDQEPGWPRSWSRENGKFEGPISLLRLL